MFLFQYVMKKSSMDSKRHKQHNKCSRYQPGYQNSSISMKICKLFKFRLKNLNRKLFFKNLDLERFSRAYIPKYNQNDLMKTCKKSRFCDFGKILEIPAFSNIEHESGIKMLVNTDCVKSVQIRSFPCSVFSRIRTEYGEMQNIS